MMIDEGGIKILVLCPKVAAKENNFEGCMPPFPLPPFLSCARRKNCGSGPVWRSLVVLGFAENDVSCFKRKNGAKWFSGVGNADNDVGEKKGGLSPGGCCRLVSGMALVGALASVLLVARGGAPGGLDLARLGALTN